MDVNPTASNSIGTATAASAANASTAGQNNVQAAVSDLGSDVFLRLLVTQLQAQDPTNPVENEDFVAQLAQFSTLEQTTNTNDLLEDLITQDTRRTELSLVNLLGRTVVSPSDIVSIAKDEKPLLTYALGKDASFMKIDILDSKGQFVGKIESSVFQKAGANEVQWDGLDVNHNRVLDGTYQFKVNAKDLEGNTVPVLTFGREPVVNIAFETENPIVLQSGKTLKQEDVISIQ